MRLGQLSGLERTKIEDELGQLNIKIADFKDILQNSERLLSIIKEEALAIKKNITMNAAQRLLLSAVKSI